MGNINSNNNFMYIYQDLTDKQEKRFWDKAQKTGKKTYVFDRNYMNIFVYTADRGIAIIDGGCGYYYNREGREYYTKFIKRLIRENPEVANEIGFTKETNIIK
jgi:hypothetical protein